MNILFPSKLTVVQRIQKKCVHDAFNGISCIIILTKGREINYSWISISLIADYLLNEVRRLLALLLLSNDMIIQEMRFCRVVLVCVSWTTIEKFAKLFISLPCLFPMFWSCAGLISKVNWARVISFISLSCKLLLR